MADRDLLVRILGDDRDLQAAIKNTDRSLQQIDTRTAAFGKNVTRAFGAAGIALGTAEIVRGVNASVQAASDLNEQIARSEQVFEENAASVRDWADSLAESFGIAQAQGLQFAGTFGLLFRNLGVSTDEAEVFSRQLVELAADLASFNNTRVDEALNALRSGLTGEIEPLRRFGVFLSEARSNQLALAESGKKSTDSLTTQEKVLARLNIIMDDTVRAQGDFARTSDSLANQQRILQAQLTNLSAAFGALLVPKVLETVGAVNDLIDAFERLRAAIPESGRGQADDFFGEFFKSLPSQIDDQVKNLQQMGRDIEFVLEHGPFQARGPGFEEVGEAISTDVDALAREVEASLPVVARVAGAIEDAIAQLNAALEAGATKLKKAQAKLDRREAERAGKEWAEFVQGMGLKLDRAGLSADLSDDLAALRELEDAILRRIEREGETFKLSQQLVRTRRQIASLTEQQAAESKRAGEDAFNATIDALTLDLDIARESKSLADDQTRLRALEQAILARIRTEGRTTDLLRQLFDVRQQQAEVAKQLREQQRERRQSEQFKALGLTEEGQERTASIAAIRKRARGLIEELKASDLPPDKIKSFVNRLSVVFTDQFDVASREVRQAILDFFATIDNTLDQGGRAGPLTKTTALNTKKLLEGLGLSPEEVNALRSRLSSFNSAGVAPGGFLSSGFNAPTGGGFFTPTVESTVTVNVTLDGEKVGKAVTKSQQKARRRNPQQKRGPNRKN